MLEVGQEVGGGGDVEVEVAIGQRVGCGGDIGGHERGGGVGEGDSVGEEEGGASIIRGWLRRA